MGDEINKQKRTRLTMIEKEYKNLVLELIKTIPKGKVVSYGQVAIACGKFRGAREVGRILRNIDISDNAIPWWRVVNNLGVISIKGNWTAGKELQARLLKEEGIVVKENFFLEIKKYRYAF